MKKTVVAVFVLVVGSVLGQDRYTKGMEKAFALWEAQKPVEAANLFERIANAEMDNWLPYYYVAQINTIAAFGEKDEDRLKQLLDKAKAFLDIAKNISTDNPELLVQEAMINTAWMAYDGATYGPTLAVKNTQLYNRALALAPENPRVVFSKAEWDMGSARYFGKDTTPYCKDVSRALELFATFKSDTPFYPKWGKEMAEKIAQQCEAE